MTQRGSRFAEELFDTNALLAGSAEVYVSEFGTVPPLLGYPITQAQSEDINELVAQGKITRGPATTLWDGMDGTIEDIDPSRTEDKEIKNGLTIKNMDFIVSGSKPTLIVELSATDSGGAAASKSLAEELNTATTDETRKSIFIQYFGRSAEFPFWAAATDDQGNVIGARMESPETAAATHVAKYIWEIDNKTDLQKIQQYTLFQIPQGGKFTFRVMRTGSKDGVTGYNSQWATFGDGLISRDAVGLATNQTITPLEIAAVLPPIELFREGAESVLSFTCFSASQDFIARITGQDPFTDISALQAPKGTAGDLLGKDIGPAYQQLSIAPRARVNKFALCLRMDDAPNEFGKQSQIYLPSVGQTGNSSFSFARTPQGTPVELTTIYNALWQTNALYMTQTNSWALTL